MNQGSLSKLGRFLAIVGRNTRIAPINMKTSPNVVTGSLYDGIFDIVESLKVPYI